MHFSWVYVVLKSEKGLNNCVKISQCAEVHMIALMTIILFSWNNSVPELGVRVNLVISNGDISLGDIVFSDGDYN